MWRFEVKNYFKCRPSHFSTNFTVRSNDFFSFSLCVDSASAVDLCSMTEDENLGRLPFLHMQTLFLFHSFFHFFFFSLFFSFFSFGQIVLCVWNVWMRRRRVFGHARVGAKKKKKTNKHPAISLRYQICLWCYQDIREKLQGRCPACRAEYDPGAKTTNTSEQNQLTMNNTPTLVVDSLPPPMPKMVVHHSLLLLLVE